MLPLPTTSTFIEMNTGSLAIFTAIRRALSLVSSLAATRLAFVIDVAQRPALLLC